MGTGQSKMEGLVMWKLSNPCMHGKTDVKPMMIMMMISRALEFTYSKVSAKADEHFVEFSEGDV